ncbi:hypothetical protein MUN89_03485 [Halobacillus salinarum]|uniref:DUF7847 domain-containing protein n=1 Tax=Halobacillus salinarum TaxID=2932257 RepID=A0ABY4ELM5_9BACI|nr:hypothetical protein [Halobacillus salinarum]UOQ45028.1 hypothetical protein MUN89_03485 [Halobacillus salinarum]
MENLKPKSFGEILDQTFTIIKQHFTQLLIILLVLIGPIYLINYLFQLASGVNLLTETGEKATFIQSIISDFGQDSEAPFAQDLDSGTGVVGGVITSLLSIVLYPMAQAAIMFAAGHSLLNENWEWQGTVKRAFSRFWPLLGSTILFGIIIGGLFFSGILGVVFSSFATFASSNPGPGGIVAAVLFMLAMVVLVAFLATRWSMFFASVAYDKVAPGLGTSWRLTKGRFWFTLGIFIVFAIFSFIINSIIQGVVTLILGPSVLASLLTNIVSLIVSLITYVGYTVLFFDLKTRHEASDVKQMISTFKEDEEETPPTLS